ALNEHHRQDGCPDRNDEYLFYQTVVGAWPPRAERPGGDREKAARESEAHPSWTTRDERYEAALRHFVGAALAEPAFTADVAAFVAPLSAPWRTTALAPPLLKATAPGIPDFYQGSELWDLNLVDPDN